MTTNIRLDLRRNDKLLKSLKTLNGTKKVVVFLYKERGEKPIILEIFKNKLPAYESKDVYNVYARSVDKPALLVFLGIANIIKTFENIHLNSIETLSIMNYIKESSMHYEDIRKILDNLDAVYSLAHSVNYYTVKTSTKKRFITEDIETPFPHYAASVSMDSSFFKAESTVEHKEKSPVNKIARKNLSRALKTTTGDIPTRKLFMTEKEKSPASDCFTKMSTNTIYNKIRTELVSFSCSIPNVFTQGLTVKDNNSIDTKNLSAIFKIGNKVFNGTIVKASIDTDSKIVGFPLPSHVSTIVSLEILIDNDSKKIIQNLLDKTDLETAAVGKLMLAATINDNINYGFTDIYISLQKIGVIYINKDNLLNNSNSKKSNSTATEIEKGTQEILKQKHNTDSKKSNSRQFEIVIASSIIKSDLKKPLKKWRKILDAEPIEILTHIHLKAGHILGFYIRKYTFETNGVVVDDIIVYRYELVAKYSVNDYIATLRNGGTTISGFVLKALHNAYIKYKQRKSENLDISHLGRLPKESQKISNQKEDLFCNKAKVSSKKNNDTAQPYQVPNPVPNPLVTILASDESKNKIKEIIEEANRTKSFPYKLDYSNNCVVKISDSLFDILECRNKLEDILKVRKDIDAGVFSLEHTGDLVLKKKFNISSLTIYYSPSKNLYALIGA